MQATKKQAKPARLYKVFHSEGGDRVLRMANLAFCEMMEKLGAWRRVYDTQTGDLKGFRIDGAEAKKVDADLRSVRTSVAISPAEMQMNAGVKGRSRTYGMRELDRLARIKDGDLPEDAIERTMAKIRVYPLIGAARGDILRVWAR